MVVSAKAVRSLLAQSTSRSSTMSSTQRSHLYEDIVDTVHTLDESVYLRDRGAVTLLLKMYLYIGGKQHQDLAIQLFDKSHQVLDEKAYSLLIAEFGDMKKKGGMHKHGHDNNNNKRSLDNAKHVFQKYIDVLKSMNRNPLSSRLVFNSFLRVLLWHMKESDAIKLYEYMKVSDCVDNYSLCHWLQYYGAHHKSKTTNLDQCKRIWNELTAIKAHSFAFIPNSMSCSMMIRLLISCGTDDDLDQVESIILSSRDNDNDNDGDVGVMNLDITEIDERLSMLMHHHGCTQITPTDAIKIFERYQDKVSKSNGNDGLLKSFPNSINALFAGYLTRGRSDLILNLYQSVRSSMCDNYDDYEDDDDEELWTPTTLFNIVLTAAKQQLQLPRNRPIFDKDNDEKRNNLYRQMKQLVQRRLSIGKWKSCDDRSIATAIEMSNMLHDSQFAYYLHRSHAWTGIDATDRTVHAYLRSFQRSHHAVNLQALVKDSFAAQTNENIGFYLDLKRSFLTVPRTADEIINACIRVGGIEQAVQTINTMRSVFPDHCNFPNSFVSSIALTNVFIAFDKKWRRYSNSFENNGNIHTCDYNVPIEIAGDLTKEVTCLLDLQNRDQGNNSLTDMDVSRYAVLVAACIRFIKLFDGKLVKEDYNYKGGNKEQGNEILVWHIIENVITKGNKNIENLIEIFQLAIIMSIDIRFTFLSKTGQILKSSIQSFNDYRTESGEMPALSHLLQSILLHPGARYRTSPPPPPPPSSLSLSPQSSFVDVTDVMNFIETQCISDFSSTHQVSLMDIGFLECLFSEAILKSQFSQGARILRLLDSPHVVRVESVGENENDAKSTVGKRWMARLLGASLSKKKSKVLNDAIQILQKSQKGTLES